MSGAADPLVVTLRCAGAGWAYCEQQRNKYFPRHRNIVPAHIALFHHLPGEQLEAVHSVAGSNSPASFEIQITSVRSLGRGVAFVIHAPPLLTLHQTLSQVWSPWLTPQDRAKFSPHVTIQNKVSPPEAQELLLTLKAEFVPFSFTAVGLEIWHYRNGPWQHAAYVPFAPALIGPTP